MTGPCTNVLINRQNKAFTNIQQQMDTSELLRRVRSIEIKTKAITNNIFAGEYHSAFKGRGMSFAEVDRKSVV